MVFRGCLFSHGLKVPSGTHGAGFAVHGKHPSAVCFWVPLASLWAASLGRKQSSVQCGAFSGVRLSALGRAGCCACLQLPSIAGTLLVVFEFCHWSTAQTLSLLHPRKQRRLSTLCSTDTNTGFSVCLFFLLFYVMWIPSPVNICTMVLIYLVTILYWEGIFKNCDLNWIFLPFNFHI